MMYNSETYGYEHPSQADGQTDRHTDGLSNTDGNSFDKSRILNTFWVLIKTEYRQLSVFFYENYFNVLNYYFHQYLIFFSLSIIIFSVLKRLLYNKSACLYSIY